MMLLCGMRLCLFSWNWSIQLLLNLRRNQRVVLDLIRRRQPVSRVELVDASGLTSGAIVRITRELLLRDLIEIGDVVGGARGQPRQPLLINAKGRFSIGAALYPHQLDVALIDFSGAIISQESFAFADDPPAEAATQIWAHARKMIRSKRLRLDKCLGVGVAVPGYLAKDNAALRTVEELATWRGADVCEIVEAETGLPCWMENIASAGALTELYRSTKQDPRHIVFVHVGYGVGAGLIVSGELYRGKGGNAGEVGVLFPGSAARPSGFDFLKTLNAAGWEHRSLAEVDFEEVSQTEIVVAWLSRASDQVARLAETASCWLAPDEFVIGGPFPMAFLDRFVQTLAAKIKMSETDMPEMRIRASWAGPRATAVGAALLPIHYNCSPSENH